MSERAKGYRDRAEELRRTADDYRGETRAIMIRCADGYERLAKNEEANEKYFGNIATKDGGYRA